MVVVTLDEAAGRGVVVVGGQGKARVFANLEDGLNQAFAEGRLTDNQSAIVILQSAGDNLRCGGSVAVDQDDDREVRTVFAAGGAVDLVWKGAAALRDYDLALLKEFIRGVNRFVE